MIVRFAKLALSACSVLCLSAAVAAQERLELPEGESWSHEHSGIVVPFTLAGVDRTHATAFSPDALNTGLSFDGDGEMLSVYVYRKTSGNVPIWFEQARYGIESRDIYAGAHPAGLTYSMTLPGRSEPSGLQAIYTMPEDASFKSTGLALFSLGNWYIKLRATSEKHDAAELEAWMRQALTELVLPEELEGASAVRAIQDCSEPLEFRKKAKDAPNDGAANLLSGMLGQMVLKEVDEGEPVKEPEVATQWCLDSDLGSNNRVYRPVDSKDRYLIAAGDSGVGISVGLDEAAQLLAGPGKRAKPRYGVTMHHDDRNVSYVAQDRLPSPQRVVELIQGKRVTMSVTTWGDGSTIEMSAGALD